MKTYVVFHYLPRDKDERLVLKSVATVCADTLTGALHRTQHPDSGVWYHNAGVEALQPSRSTRPGDLIARVVAGGDVEGWYRVDEDGFTEIQRPQVTRSRKEVAPRCTTSSDAFSTLRLRSEARSESH